MKLSTATLGFPRMGPNRELKFALEKYWKGSIKADDLLTVAHDIEEQGWMLQKKAGIDRITVGDFYLYDGILAWNEMIGFVPSVLEVSAMEWIGFLQWLAVSTAQLH